jgi:hypothetical protein
LVLQSCTDPLQVLPGSSCETLPLSDGTYDGNIKFEEVIHIKKKEKVDVKAEKGIDSEEEECIDIKDEDIRSQEEWEEDEDMGIEEEGVDIKEEVSFEDTV